MEMYESMILSLAALYQVPVVFTDALGNKIRNEAIQDALAWASLKLADKSERDIKMFANCVKEGFEKTTSLPFPLRPDLNRAFRLCFEGIANDRDSTKNMLSGLRIEYNHDEVKDVKPEPLDFLKYLREESALRLTRGPKYTYDFLFKKYGFSGMRIVAKWQGEYAFDNCIDQSAMGDIDWIEVYKERPPKEVKK